MQPIFVSSPTMHEDYIAQYIINILNFSYFYLKFPTCKLIRYLYLSILQRQLQLIKNFVCLEWHSSLFTRKHVLRTGAGGVKENN